MKIILFNSVKAWGGGEKWHLETAVFLKNKGHQVKLCCDNRGMLYKKAISKGIEVIPVRVGNLSFINPYRILTYLKIFKSNKPDIIVYNISRDIKSAAVIAKYIGVKINVYRRGSEIAIKNKIFNKFLFKNIITHVLANSQATKKSINKNGSLFPEHKIKVIYNGIDTSQYTVIKKNKRTELPTIIGSLGRLEYQKNHKALITVAVLLRKQGVDNFKIKIGGTGRLEDGLQKEVEKEQLEQYFEFCGYIEDVSSFMNSLDVFVLPSHWEGFGYVAAEASLHNIPVVAFDVSSNPEVIKHNETGILAPYHNLDELTNAIRLLLDNSLLRGSMGEKGNVFVRQNFEAEKNQKRIEKYFKELV